MKQIEKVWAAINAQKQNSVNLSSVGALEQARKGILNYFSKRSDFVRKADQVIKDGNQLRSRAQESMRDLEIMLEDQKDATSRAKTVLKEFASAARELGVKPTENNQYRELQTAIETMQGEASAIKDVMKELRPFNK